MIFCSEWLGSISSRGIYGCAMLCSKNERTEMRDGLWQRDNNR